MKPRIVFIIATLLGLSLCTHYAVATVPEVVPDKDTPVYVKDVAPQDGTVSGVLVNKSSHPVRDVELLVERTFFWKNEFKPGNDSPSRSAVFKVPEQIPPGGSAPFTYHASSSLPERADGYFQTSVKVVGFSQVGQ